MEHALGASGTVGIFAWNPRTYRATLNGHVPAFYRRILASEMPASAAAPVVQRGYASMSAAQRAEAIERLIRETVATLLGLDSYTAVERDKGLFDLGIDSLTAIDLKDRLEKALGQPLRSTIAFDYPTAAAMAVHLAETLFPAGPAQRAPAVVVPTKLAASGANGAPADENLSAMAASDLEALLEKELEG